MTVTNADKAQHGKSAQDALEAILKRCKNQKLITLYAKGYRKGMPGFCNNEQFYSTFMIQFTDESKWLLYSTTSMRTDRIKGQQWDAANLKEIDTQITAAYLVYPDGLSDNDKNEFVRQNNKYSNGEEFSAIDGIVPQDRIESLIEKYALDDVNSGRTHDRLGNEYESRVACTLNYPDNLRKWKTGSPNLEGVHYDTFLQIVTCFDLNCETINRIDATADKRRIGRLPSGGNPKTDVLVTVYYDNEKTEIYTISCKRSGEDRVSVHQYTADLFADVLNHEDMNLRSLLNEFQRNGNRRDFGKENERALEDALAPYNEALSMWVLGGFGGGGSEQQCARYILTYDSNTGNSFICSTYDYYCKLVAAGVKGDFGTLFSWTYPSKRKGKSIQLKTRII